MSVARHGTRCLFVVALSLQASCKTPAGQGQAKGEAEPGLVAEGGKGKDESGATAASSGFNLSGSTTGTASGTTTATATGATGIDGMYASVRAALVSAHPNAPTWQETTADFANNWIMQSPLNSWDSPTDVLKSGTTCVHGSSGCDLDFNLVQCSSDAVCGTTGTCQPVLASVKKPGDTPVNMCVGPGDYIEDRIYSTLIKAKSTIDITSLSPPTGRYLTAILNALLYLDRSGAHPDVRILFGGASATLPSAQTPTQYVATWMKVLKAQKPDFSLTIACGWLSHFSTWNHSKIIAVDSTEAIVGSMNLWESDYLQPKPVFDMSFNVTGAVAASATHFTDQLWAALPQGTLLSQLYPSVGILPSGAKIQMKHTVTGNGAPGATPVLGVGRLGGFGDDASDTAIDALIRTAQTSVKIVQQDLYNVSEAAEIQPYGMDAIVDRISHGVDVYIIKSSQVDGTTTYSMYSPRDTFDYLGRYIEKKLGHSADDRPKGTYYRAVCDHLHLAPMHYSPNNPPRGNVKSHTKLIVADEKAFYLGSQNMYHANLCEYGNIIFDESAGQQLMDQYWDRAWGDSASFQIPCTPVD